MNVLLSSSRILRNCLPLVLVALMLVVSGCKDDETTSVSGESTFLLNTEYGLYPENARGMVYQKYEHQFSRTTDGRSFRLQTDNLSQLVACTFSSDLSSDKSVEVTLRTVGISKVKDGTSTFAVKKTEAGKCWLWDNKNRIGIIVPTE